jgi:hypothetical protein
MILSTRIPDMRKFSFINMKKISFGEGQIQDQIPALPGIGSKIPAVLLGNS